MRSPWLVALAPALLGACEAKDALCDLPPAVPTFVSATTGWVDVASIPSAICGIRDSGELVCWGDTAGLDLPERALDVMAYTSAESWPGVLCWVDDEGNVSCNIGTSLDGQAVTAGLCPNLADGPCGLRADGAIVCPDGILDPGPYIQASCKDWNGFCGLAADASVTCSNFPEEPQTLPGSFVRAGAGCGVRADGEIVCVDQAPPGFELPWCAPATDVVVLADAITCHIGQDGTPWCFEELSPDLGGRGFEAPGDRPVRSVGGVPFCGITFDGHLACWNDPVWWSLEYPSLLEEVTTK